MLVREEPDAVPETLVDKADTQIPEENPGDRSVRVAKKKSKPIVRVYHDDIIGDTFWDGRPNILNE